MATQSTPKQLLELWGFTRGRRLPLYVGALLSVVVALLTLIQPVFVSQLVSNAESGESPAISLIVLLCVVIVAVVGCSAAKDYMLESSAEWLVASTRRRLVKAILGAPLMLIGRWRSGDVAARITSDATTLRLAVTGGIVDFAGAILTLTGAIIALVILDWVTFVIVLAAAVVAAGVTAVGARGLKRVTEDQQTAIGVLGDTIDKSLRSIKLLKAYGLTDRSILDADRASDKAMQSGFKLAKIRAVFIPLSEISFQTAFIVVVLAGTIRVASGTISMADLAAFILFVSLMTGPVSILMAVVATMSEALGAYNRIQSTINASGAEVGIQASRLKIKSHESSGHEDKGVMGEGPSAVTFNQVTFRYPGAEEDALTDVSFQITPGSVTALVGQSGAGKSTIFSLIERFYEPGLGTIELNEHDLSSISEATLRENTSLVLQEPGVWGDTVWDNLTLGATYRTEKVEGVLHELGMTPFINRLPNGLMSSMGAIVNTASGGELQRLSIARAFLREPKLILLDEPTSSLDDENETLVQALIEKMRGQATILVIAHRLRTIENADAIIALDMGRIASTSSAEELSGPSSEQRPVGRFLVQ